MELISNDPVETILHTVTQILLYLSEFLFNDKSTLVGNFVLSPRERKKRDRKANRGEEKKKMKENANDKAETDEILA